MKKYEIKRFSKIGQRITYYYDKLNDKWIHEDKVTSFGQYAFEFDSTKIHSFLKELKNSFRSGHNDVRLYNVIG